MKVAIYIPAYNEERSIGSVVLLARKYGKVFVVDDGSDDKTGEIARSAGAAVITKKKNGGYGAALSTAFSHAKKAGADAVVFIDADFQHDPSEIPSLVAPILENKADAVLGSRFLGKFVNAPAGRKEGVAFINTLSGIQSGGGSFDYQCGFRAFSKRSMRTIEIPDNGYSTGAQMIIAAQNASLRIKEIPSVVRYYDDASPGALAQAAELVKYAVGEIAKKRPLFYFGASGIALLLASFFIGVFVVETFYSTKSLPIGSALLCVFTGIGGLLLLINGINLYTLQSVMRQREIG